jgi:hypothetical protein
MAGRQLVLNKPGFASEGTSVAAFAVFIFRVWLAVSSAKERSVGRARH